MRATISSPVANRSTLGEERVVANGRRRKDHVPGSVRTDSGVWEYAEAHGEDGECGCLDII